MLFCLVLFSRVNWKLVLKGLTGRSSGSPSGLTGAEILLKFRIIAVLDVFDILLHSSNNTA
ncbi:MAG: hypothetical protein HUJ74_04700 [Lachnospiraceae bacterium]|nr:hypothetical protein [Lachnospiraceae bacterium]